MGRKALEAEAKIEPKPEKQQAVRPKPRALIWICVASWLIPGLGHFVQGRKVRGAILLASIIAMFALGVAMKGQFYPLASLSYLESLGGLGEMAVGVVMPATSFFGYSGGKPLFASADYGTAFLISAGMLNLLALLDAYDIAIGRKK